MAEFFRQFVRFAGVGLMSAIGHYGLLIFLVQVLGMGAVIASSAGAVLGAFINYSLNYRFTFRSTKQHKESISKFAIVALIALLFNMTFMWIGINLLGAHYFITQIVTTGLVMIWSFLSNRYWTFYQNPPQE